MANSKQKRNKFYCPKEFLEWIEVSNYCPASDSLGAFENEMDNFIVDHLFELNSEMFVENWMKRADLDEGLIEYCIEKNDREMIWDFVKELFRIARVLRSCASRNRNINDLQKRTRVVNFKDLVQNNPQIKESFQNLLSILQSDNNVKERFQGALKKPTYLEDQIKFEVELIIERDSNFLKPSESRFINFLSEENIDVRNIRFCSNCGNIFWIKRQKQLTCSKKCSNVWTVKKWRENNREYHNEQRRKTYKSKKEQQRAKERRTK